MRAKALCCMAAALLLGSVSFPAAAAPVPTAGPTSGGMGMPTGGLVTTYFLEPINYETSGQYYDASNVLRSVSYTFHHGLDTSGGCTAGVYPIYAATSGIVAIAQYINDGYGTQVVIDHGYNTGSNGHYTYGFYAHMGNRSTGQRYITVTPGQYVSAGQLIGYQGNDGTAYGSCSPSPGTHLDWEVRVSNAAVTYSTTMRYSTIAASPNFYTYQQLTYGDPNPATYVSPGPFNDPPRPSTPTPRPPTGTPTPRPQPTATPGPCGMRFSDLPDTHWAYVYISYLYCRGIVSGYADGTFRPESNNTRAQFAKMVVLGHAWTLYNPYFPTFTDLPPANEYYRYVETARLREIIGGYRDCTFRPGNSVTRAQAVKMLVLAHGWQPIYPRFATFSDVPPTHWAYGYITAAVQHGIAGGRGDGTFGPEEPINRAQLCKMLALTIQQLRR